MTGKMVSRRQFLKHAGATAALLGLSEAMIPQLAKALQTLAAGKPPIIWIQGQNCTGCSISFLNSNYPGVAELVLDKLSVRYQPNVMAAAGQTAVSAISDTVAAAKDGKGFYVLVVEGPVPTKANGEYCTFGLIDKKKNLAGTGAQVPGDKTVQEWMKELVPRASAVIANGNCASFGGIPAANAGTTGTTPVGEIVARIDPKKPMVNVGGCPSHPDWFVGTALEALIALGVLPGGKQFNLNENKMSKTFFGQMIHENCERRGAFDAGMFLENWNDQSPDFKLCMFKQGCKGPVTYADCPVRRWNSGVNWCVGASAPCHGCASPSFYKELAPLYQPLPNMNLEGLTTTTDVAGWVAAGATAVGIGAHYLYKQLGSRPEEAEGGGK
ncbi:MAG: hydrogenase small subunit [Candidatus Geothermincolia bacterium]